ACGPASSTGIPACGPASSTGIPACGPASSTGIPACGPASGPDASQLQITKRNLPHWRLDGSTYFITFRLVRGSLGSSERRIILDHVKTGDGPFYRLIAATV